MAKSTALLKLEQLTKRVETAVEQALIQTGKEGIGKLIQEEFDSDTTGRLRDSFTYATKDKPASPRSEATNADAVAQPLEKNTVNIGTRVPYAPAVNYGFGSSQVGPFEYGKNGNANNFEELVDQILEWMQNKGIYGMGTSGPGGDGAGTLDIAYMIARKIETSGTIAHPFWEQSVQYIKEQAKANLRQAISQEFRKSKKAQSNIDTIDIKF